MYTTTTEAQTASVVTSTKLLVHRHEHRKLTRRLIEGICGRILKTCFAPKGNAGNYLLFP
jgi:hypothetical protein